MALSDSYPAMFSEKALILQQKAKTFGLYFLPGNHFLKLIIPHFKSSLLFSICNDIAAHVQSAVYFHVDCPCALFFSKFMYALLVRVVTNILLQVKKITSGRVGNYPGQSRVGLLFTAGQK